MFRQVNSRNQRSKGGLKVKHVLQLCILVGVTLWLLYQINHSHYKKKAYEESAALSAQFGHDQPEITRLNRKDLPREDAEAAEERLGHEVIGRSGGDQKMDGQDREKAAQNAHGEEGNGQAKRETSGHEEHEHSHEAREKTFAADDASSEVGHHSIITQEREHEERSHEAQEKIFKADDVSSAVDHVAQVKQPEPENEGIKDLNEKLPEDTEKKDKENENIADDALEDPEGNSSATETTDTAKETDSENAVTKLTEVSLSNATVSDPDNATEHQPYQTAKNIVKNDTQTQSNSTNNLDDHLELPSSTESKDQIIPERNSSPGNNQTILVNPTTSVAAEDKFNTSIVLRDQRKGYDSEKIEQKEKSDTTEDKQDKPDESPQRSSA